ncbi:Cyclopentanone 1,2-monooxygenase (CPMO), partial [Bulinus truncatus]
IVNNRTTLYKYMFPPHLPHPTLSAIGLVQAIGAVMPIAEVQSRWFTSLVTGKSKLPSRQVMEEDIQNRRDMMSRNYVSSRRHTMQTFWIDYMDQVSSEIGSRPNLWKMLLRDPELALKCYLGPCLPSQYRLYGPGRWGGARQFIINTYLRANKPKADCRAATVSKNKQRSICADSVSSSHVQIADQGQRSARWLYRKDEDRGQRRPKFIMSPDWATLLFYVIIMLACGFFWFMGGLLDKAGVIINSLEGTLDHRLPITE